MSKSGRRAADCRVRISSLENKQDVQFENKFLRAELERLRQEKQTIEDFWIRMPLGKAQRRDTEIAAKQEASDQALAGPNGA